MALLNSKDTYGSISKILHWIIGLLIVIMVSGSFFLDDITDKDLRHSIINLHKLIGIAILLLMIIRIVWAFYNIKPSLPNSVRHWQKIAARSIHILFYIVLIAMPLSGWIMSMAAGHIPHLGSLQLPLPWIPKNKVLDDTFFTVHQYLAWVIIALITLHILAAIKHALINRDGVLQKML